MPNLTENDKGSTDLGSTATFEPPHPNKLDTQTIINTTLNFISTSYTTNVTK